MKWDTIDQLWIRFDKSRIFLFGSVADSNMDPLLGGYKTLIVNICNHLIKCRDFPAEHVVIIVGNKQYFRVFYGVDIVDRWFPGKEAFPVARPPIFGCKTINMLDPPCVDRVGPKTSFDHKSNEFPYIAFLKEVLPSS